MSDAEESAKLDRVIELGGVQFKVVDFDLRTVLIDHYLMRRLRESGADKVMPMDGENEQAYLVRMQSALLDSGKCPELLAGILIPPETSPADWTPQGAAKIAKFIGGLNTQADREQVIQISLEVVFGFFVQGLAWLKRSRASLEAVSRVPSQSGNVQQAAH